mgnify:CR=1 FL=1
MSDSGVGDLAGCEVSGAAHLPAALAEASDLLGLKPVPEFAHGDLV